VLTVLRLGKKKNLRRLITIEGESEGQKRNKRDEIAGGGGGGGGDVRTLQLTDLQNFAMKTWPRIARIGEGKMRRNNLIGSREIAAQLIERLTLTRLRLNKKKRKANKTGATLSVAGKKKTANQKVT